MKSRWSKIFGLVILGGALLAGLLVWREYRAITRHQNNYAQIEQDIKALADRRPAGVTPNQWQYMVGWTLTGLGNCLASHRWVSPEEFARFSAELHRRCAGTVDAATIDWIWDEMVRLNPSLARGYAESYRPTTPEHLSEAEYVHINLPAK